MEKELVGFAILATVGIVFVAWPHARPVYRRIGARRSAGMHHPYRSPAIAPERRAIVVRTFQPTAPRALLERRACREAEAAITARDPAGLRRAAQLLCATSRAPRVLESAGTLMDFADQLESEHPGQQD